MMWSPRNLGVGVALAILLGAVACVARPPSADAAYGDLQDGGPLEGNSLSGGVGVLGVGGEAHTGGRLMGDPQDTALAALQMQLMQQYANYNSMRSQPWEQFLRAPQEKRKIRYRQCYFNPISCFRK